MLVRIRALPPTTPLHELFEQMREDDRAATEARLTEEALAPFTRG